MIKKLRSKFVCVIMLVATVLICTVLGVVLYFTGSIMELQSVSMMRSIAVSPFQLGTPGAPTAEIRLPFFTVQTDHRGQVISAISGYYDLSDKAFVQEVADAALNSKSDTGELEQYNLRYCKTVSPSGQSIVFADTSAEQATLRDMLYSCLLIGAAALAAFLGISIFLSHWVVKPVSVAWEQQRQFVADASHELKTPLAVIMANAELLHSDEQSEGERKTFSGNILQTSYQMRTLVESLLEMARVDSDHVKMNFESLDYSQLVTDAVLSVQLLYEEQEKELKSNIADGICLRGSEQHLYQVMDVLLDNALKYSLPQSAVYVQLVRHGRGCLLSVSSRGNPISKEDRKNIFKRFYRADKARTMNGSYGLGLSIADAIVNAHKGKIWAESQDGWNTFRVQLPTA